LRKRSLTRRDNSPRESREPIQFASAEEHSAALKFFNAAYRAEQSGSGQAEHLAGEVRGWDPELAETLELYGQEEAWHRELLTDFFRDLGGSVQPMGRVTRLFFKRYAAAERMESIVLTNLMFETIGATTYKLTLRRTKEERVRRMLNTLASDEAFHVPLNVYFLKRTLSRCDRRQIWRLRVLHELLFVALVLLPVASRPKSRAFDGLGTLELARAYARALGELFVDEREIPLAAPRWLLWLLDVSVKNVHPRRA
jgi:hypothetical protein